MHDFSKIQASVLFGHRLLQGKGRLDSPIRRLCILVYCSLHSPPSHPYMRPSGPTACLDVGGVIAVALVILTRSTPRSLLGALVKEVAALRCLGLDLDPVGRVRRFGSAEAMARAGAGSRSASTWSFASSVFCFRRTFIFASSDFRHKRGD